MATVEKAFIKKKGYLYKLPLSPGIIKVISKLEMQQMQKETDAFSRRCGANDGLFSTLRRVKESYV